MKLRTLVSLQAVFAFASVTYLLLSAWRLNEKGEALSAAAIVPSLILFGLYSASLFLVRLPKLIWYRIAMGLAILFFGGGGVVGNIVRYMDTGLEQYANFSAWALAVTINGYGTILNIMAVFALFNRHLKNLN